MVVLAAPEDRKLTEEEVLNELQSASEWFAEHGKNTNTAIIGICKRAIDLINQKNEVIEELLDANEHLAVFLDETIVEKDKMFDQAKELIKTARAEAIKEFAERMKALITEIEFVEDWDINQIAKEMGVM